MHDTILTSATRDWWNIFSDPLLLTANCIAIAVVALLGYFIVYRRPRPFLRAVAFAVVLWVLAPIGFSRGPYPNAVQPPNGFANLLLALIGGSLVLLLWVAFSLGKPTLTNDATSRQWKAFFSGRRIGPFQ